MRKQIIERSGATLCPPSNWLDVEVLATVELTSEDAAYPIESALRQDGAAGWRAGMPGRQIIRLVFDAPLTIQRIYLNFMEPVNERTQEYVLRWSPDSGQSFHEIVRQQWNFNPAGAVTETEDYQVQLSGVTMLELDINPDISGRQVMASIDKFYIA